MKRINIFIVALLATFSAFAEYTGLIWTPNRTAILVTFRDEHDADYLNYLTESTRVDFPAATIRGNSSNLYNSHCYAWYMQNNYDINRECWLNNASVPTFWEDGSYVQTTSDDATVIYYTVGEHSAIKSWIVSSYYISKWCDGPLMEHAPEYGPYTNMMQRTYYKLYEAPTPEPEPETPEEPEIEIKSLMPGSGDYISNHEYEFYPGAGFEFDDKYVYVWSIYEGMDEERDAVALGKVTIDNEEYPHIAKITFLSRGLYTINLAIYNGDDELVDGYTCQPYVL